MRGNSLSTEGQIEVQGPAGVRAGIRDTSRQIPEPELCLGFAVPYPGMDLGSSPGIS